MKRGSTYGQEINRNVNKHKPVGGQKKNRWIKGERQSNIEREREKEGTPTCRHDAGGGHRHHGDVLRGVGRVQVRPHRSHLGATTPFLLGAPPYGTCVHGDGARHGEHSGRVVGGRRVRERAGLVRAELLLHLVQEHGVLNL